MGKVTPGLISEHAHMPILEAHPRGRPTEPSDKPHGPASAGRRAPRPGLRRKQGPALHTPRPTVCFCRHACRRLVLAELVLYISGCGLALVCCLVLGNWRVRLRRTITLLGSVGGKPKKREKEKKRKNSADLPVPRRFDLRFRFFNAS